jgi:hypothetical protein
MSEADAVAARVLAAVLEKAVSFEGVIGWTPSRTRSKHPAGDFAATLREALQEEDFSETVNSSVCCQCRRRSELRSWAG